jgi:hypothetical protein
MATARVTAAPLSKSRVEKALNKWIRSIRCTGTVTSLGVQENRNSARADIQFNNFKYKISGFGGKVEEKTYSGKGFATFTRYNDGRWVLSTVYTNQGMNSRWWEGIGQVVE